MNERIKQLAEHAGFMLWQDEKWNPGDVIDWSSRYDDELVKFAELIVRKCVSVVSKRKNQAIDDGWNVDEAMSMAEMDIEEHFGVGK